MKKLVTILTLFIMIITCIVPLSAKTKVKVAYPIQDGLTEISENGVFSGYTYDYLKDPKPLPTGEHDTGAKPKDLADAIRMQYEDTQK